MPLGADVYRVCNLLAVASTGRRKHKYREWFSEKNALKLILASIRNRFSPKKRYSAIVPLKMTLMNEFNER